MINTTAIIKDITQNAGSSAFHTIVATSVGYLLRNGSAIHFRDLAVLAVVSATSIIITNVAKKSYNVLVKPRTESYWLNYTEKHPRFKDLLRV